MAAPAGNNNARRGRAWTEALKRALARYSGKSVDAGLDLLADRMVRAAAEGDDQATVHISERIGDRLEGKPAQIIAGDDELPIGNGLTCACCCLHRPSPFA